MNDGVAIKSTGFESFRELLEFSYSARLRWRQVVQTVLNVFKPSVDGYQSANHFEEFRGHAGSERIDWNSESVDLGQ
jgi:hypothetical protein